MNVSQSQIRDWDDSQCLQSKIGPRECLQMPQCNTRLRVITNTPSFCEHLPVSFFFTDPFFFFFFFFLVKFATALTLKSYWRCLWIYSGLKIIRGNVWKMPLSVRLIRIRQSFCITSDWVIFTNAPPPLHPDLRLDAFMNATQSQNQTGAIWNHSPMHPFVRLMRDA